MFLRPLAVLAVGILCCAECVQVAKTDHGRIHVLAFSPIGESLQEHTGIEVVKPMSKQSWKVGPKGIRLPYGEYLLQVQSPGFKRVDRKINLQQPELHVRVELPVAIECGGFASLQGVLRPMPRQQELWVKMVQARGTEGGEALVRADGHFTIAGLHYGTHVLLVMDGTKVVRSLTVETYHSPITVDLPVTSAAP